MTVAIATYDGRRLLETLLPSLAAQSFRDFGILVVDDCSNDDTVAWLREHWPSVEIITHSSNLGVTAALNTCLRSAKGELIALFNNDIELDRRCLEEMVATIERCPQAGSVACKLVDYHDRRLIDGAGDLLRWSGTAWRRGHGELDRGQYDSPRDIFGACGGAALYRRSALEQVGLLDEDFHAFYEDVDWALRAQLRGFTCRYAPSAVAYHMGSATLGRGLSDFTRYRLTRNGVWLVAKGFPASVLMRHAHQLIAGQAANALVAARDRKLRVWLAAWRDALLAAPMVMRKRRAVQRGRQVSARELEARLGAEAAQWRSRGSDQTGRRRRASSARPPSR